MLTATEILNGKFNGTLYGKEKNIIYANGEKIIANNALLKEILKVALRVKAAKYNLKTEKLETGLNKIESKIDQLNEVQTIEVFGLKGYKFWIEVWSAKIYKYVTI